MTALADSRQILNLLTGGEDVKYSAAAHVVYVLYICCVAEGMGEPAVVEQVDVAPTLALALALPISQNSVGRLIPAVFEKSSLREQLRYLHINGHQLSNLLRDSNPSFHKGETSNM